MKINTYNYTKGTKNIYDKKYHGCCRRCCSRSWYRYNRSKIKNETFKLSSKNSADLNIYVLNRTYDYQLWETDLSHDISSDSYLGNGTIKRPVGLIITVSKNS